MTVFATARGIKLKVARLTITGFDVVRVILALILLAAAALKAQQVASETVANKDIFSYRWSLIFQAEFEILLGLWLLSGLHKWLAWTFAIASFSFFSCVTLYKALAGETSCGCFGRVEVNPWYTLILDVFAVVALLILRPDLRKPQFAKYYWPRLATALVLVLTAGISAGLAMASYTPAVITAQGKVLGNSEFVVLEPQKWLGKRFPLIDYIDIGDRLASGQWIVVLYHHDCPDCRYVVPRYEQFARSLASQADQAKVALIEIPPYAEKSNALVSADSPCVRGRLTNAKKWSVKTPAVVILSAGTVAILLR